MRTYRYFESLHTLIFVNDLRRCCSSKNVFTEVQHVIEGLPMMTVSLDDH